MYRECHLWCATKIQHGWIPRVHWLWIQKAFYDSLDNELPQDDKNSVLEVPITLEFLKRIGGRARWVPHNKNPADAMTKFKGAHMELLLELLRSGMYVMLGEREELESRAQQKQTGTVRRNKTSAVIVCKIVPHLGS